MTPTLFAMEEDETPEMEDMADGLGEIANVAAGVMKASRAAAGLEVELVELLIGEHPVFQLSEEAEHSSPAKGVASHSCRGKK